MKSVAAILLAFFCVSVIALESKPPAPSLGIEIQHDQNNAQATQQATKDDKRCTEGVPIFVKIVPAPGSETHTAEQKKERAQTSANERGLVVATWVLGIVTGALVLVAVVQAGLFVWQLRLLKQNTMAAIDAANAARRSAEALPLVERAYVYAKVVFDGDKRFTEAGDRIGSRLMAVFYNGGKTPAVISTIRVTWYIGVDTPDALPILDGSDRTLSEGWAIRPGGEEKELQKIEIIKEQLARIEQSTSFLFCYGLLEYRDVLGEDRETGFCWQYSQQRKGWIISESELNYCR